MLVSKSRFPPNATALEVRLELNEVVSYTWQGITRPVTITSSPCSHASSKNIGYNVVDQAGNRFWADAQFIEFDPHFWSK